MSVVRAAAAPATLAEIAVWWAMLVGVWLLTLSSSVNAAEVVVAGACAVPCAVAARLARAAVGGHWRFRGSWLTWTGPLLRSAIVDGAKVLAVALRQRTTGASVGHLYEVSLPDEGDGAHAAGQEGCAELTLSATPGTFVVHGDPETLVVHALTSGRSRLAERVSR